MFTWQQNCLLPLNKRNDVWWSCQVWVVRGADHKLWSTLCKLQAWKKALGRVKRQHQDVDLGIGNQLTLPTIVCSRHSDRSIENETKVHCVSKTDCLVSRVSAVLPDPCLACNGPAESTWQTRWLAEEAEPGGNGRSSGSVYYVTACLPQPSQRYTSMLLGSWATNKHHAYLSRLRDTLYSMLLGSWATNKHHAYLSRLRDTLACCWVTEQPTNTMLTSAVSGIHLHVAGTLSNQQTPCLPQPSQRYTSMLLGHWATNKHHAYLSRLRDTLACCWDNEHQTNTMLSSAVSEIHYIACCWEAEQTNKHHAYLNHLRVTLYSMLLGSWANQQTPCLPQPSQRCTICMLLGSWATNKHHAYLSRLRDTLACCWDNEQPTNTMLTSAVSEIH